MTCFTSGCSVKCAAVSDVGLVFTRLAIAFLFVCSHEAKKGLKILDYPQALGVFSEELRVKYNKAVKYGNRNDRNGFFNLF